jgi:hypothetical protein
VALGQSSSVISLKNKTFLKRQLYRFVKNQKMCSLFPWQHGISYLFYLEKINDWRKNQNGGQKLKWRRVDFF